MALSKQDREEITVLIKTVVNGNILRIESKLDQHIINHDELLTELKPVAEAVSWINTSKKFVVWISGFVIAITSIISISKFLK